MAMIRISRLILQKSSSSSRWLSTVTETSTAVTQRERRILLQSRMSQANSNTNVTEILNEWVNQGNPMKRYDVINLINFFRNRKNFQSALQVYDWLDGSNLATNNADQAIRIDLLCKTEGLAAAEDYFNKLHASDKNNKTYGSLLSCYCKEGAYEKALEMFEKMKMLSQTSTLNYNIMLSHYSKMDQHEKVVLLVQEMESYKIAGDILTYNTLIKSYDALKNLDAIEGVLEKMKEDKVKCDWLTYKNVATIYVNSGLYDKACAVLEELEKLINRPGEEGFDAFRALTKLYLQMNDLPRIYKAWEFLKLTFTTPNSTSYHTMLSAVKKLGDLENVEKLYKEWEEGCSTYDIRLPNVMLEFYLNRDMVEEAAALYESMENRGIEPNLSTLNSLAKLFIKKHEIDLAIKYLEMGMEKVQSKTQKWFPRDDTVNLFLIYFEEKGDTDRARKFIEIMKKIDDSDSSRYDSLVSKISASKLAVE